MLIGSEHELERLAAERVAHAAPDQPARDYAAFTRYACKMATGAGKTTVMGMLAAWSILNKAGRMLYS